MRPQPRHGIVVLILAGLTWGLGAGVQPAPIRFPAQDATGVSPDTPLALTFGGSPAVGSSGDVRVYDAAEGTLVNRLDLSVPPGPTRLPPADAASSAEPPPVYQRTVIGGFTEGFHFYPDA